MPEKDIQTVNQLHGLVESLVHECREWLPQNPALGKFISTNHRLAPEIRTRLAFLEDATLKADQLVKPTLNEPPKPAATETYNGALGRIVREI